MDSTLSVSAASFSARDIKDRISKIYSDKSAWMSYKSAVESGDDAYAAALRVEARTQGWTSIVAPVDTIAAKIDETFTAIVADFNDQTASIRDDLAASRITTLGASERADKFVPALLARLTVASAEAAVFRNGAQRAYDLAVRSITKPSGDVNEQLLTEMRIGRAWDRLKAELDAAHSRGASLLLTVFERIQHCDQFELAALITEYDSYLTAHGETDNDDLIQQQLKLISPVVAEAAENLEQLEAFQAYLVHNAQVVRTIITNPSLVPGNLAAEHYLSMTRDYSHPTNSYTPSSSTH